MKNDQKYFFNLLLWIVGMLLVTPLFEGGIGVALVNLFFTFILVSVIYTLSEKHKTRLVLWGLVAPTLLFNWIGYFSPAYVWNMLTLVFAIAFLGVTISVLFRGVLSRKRIGLDQIYGALCIYFLVGLFWAMIFTLNELIIPNSYSSNLVLEGDVMMHLKDFIYFSFVTLTTLGYGDMVPLTAEARNLCVVEAVGGQFYIATVVAALVGSVLRDRKH